MEWRGAFEMQETVPMARKGLVLVYLIVINWILTPWIGHPKVKRGR